MIGAGETITVVRPAVGVDRYGNPTKDWAAATRVDVSGVAVGPAAISPAGTGTRENTAAGREGVAAAFTVYCPAAADIRATDRVEMRGDLFDVDGEPAVWVSPYSGWEPGVVAALRRVEG